MDIAAHTATRLLLPMSTATRFATGTALTGWIVPSITGMVRNGSSVFRTYGTARLGQNVHFNKGV